MQTIIHPIFEYNNLLLNSDNFKKIIDSSKNLAVIYSFKKELDQYIGRTINLQSRLREHKISPFINSKRKNCTILYNAVNKYGWDKFTFEILEVFQIDNSQDSRDKLIKLMAKKEEIYIKNLKPSYNVILSEPYWDLENNKFIKKADRSHLKGISRTEIVKNKISLKLKGNLLSDKKKMQFQ